MNNSEWCVIFAINDKVQNFTTCYNTTENAVYEFRQYVWYEWYV